MANFRRDYVVYKLTADTKIGLNIVFREYFQLQLEIEGGVCCNL